MSLKFLALLGCLVLSACSPSALPPRGIWRGAVDNGDKPGIGIELVQSGTQLTGKMFVLDPSQPGVFKAGRKFPIKILRSTGTEIRFAVDFGQGHPDERILRVKLPLADERISTMLQSADGLDELREYVLTKVK